MKWVYKYLPVSLQNVACSLYGYKEKRKRYGEWFDYWSKKLKETEFYTEQEVVNYQQSQLKKIMEEAYHNVPYYGEVFEERNLKPQDIENKEDLKKLPILTKEIINAQPEKFLNERFTGKDLIKNKTSGTTGKSLKFYTTEEALSFQWAVWWRHRNRFGFEFGDKHLNFTGKPVVPVGEHKPPYWRWNKAFNQALVSMQAIRKENITDIASFINKEKFKYWTGYPSIIHDFCSFLLESETELAEKPKVIFLGAENIYEGQKKDIQKATGAIITDQYGFTEGAGNASQCKEYNHHSDFEFGILECVDQEQLKNGEKRGKIVCTGFANKAFPFIRYEVGDVGVWSDNDFKCPCGRKSQVLKRVEGRIEDYVITPEGKRIMRFDYLFKDTSEIKEAQIVQKKEGEITINIVRRDGYRKETEKKLRNDIKEWISPNLRVHFEYLSKIPREDNGKFRAVKSELN